MLELKHVAWSLPDGGEIIRDIAVSYTHLDVYKRQLDVGTIIMPKIPDSIVPTTKTYTSVLESIRSKGLKITTPVSGTTYDPVSSTHLDVYKRQGLTG